jgi:hypothetical protein
MLRRIQVFAGVAVLLAGAAIRVQAAQINVGNAVGGPGQQVTITVTLVTEGDVVAATQNDIVFDPAIVDLPMVSSCRINPTISNLSEECQNDPTSGPCKALSRNLGDCPGAAGCPQLCTGGTNDGQSCSTVADCPGGGTCDADPAFDGFKRFRGLVFTTDNTNPITDQAEFEIYTCTFNLTGDVGESAVLNNINVGGSDSSGAPVDTTGGNGQIDIVGAPTDTPTATETPTVPEPTATNTPVPPTATNTPVPPTATNTRGAGSDDDDGCQIVALERSNSGWVLLLPAAALLWLRRRSR